MSSFFSDRGGIDNDKYNQYKKMQSELDGKMQELHRVPDSIYQMQQEQYNTTIMIGVVWSMLATASLYYVFKNV